MSVFDVQKDSFNDMVEQLFALTSKLEQDLPNARAEGSQMPSALSAEQFDSLLASW